MEVMMKAVVTSHSCLKDKAQHAVLILTLHI